MHARALLEKNKHWRKMNNLFNIHFFPLELLNTKTNDLDFSPITALEIQHPSMHNDYIARNSSDILAI